MSKVNLGRIGFPRGCPLPLTEEKFQASTFEEIRRCREAGENVSVTCSSARKLNTTNPREPIMWLVPSVLWSVYEGSLIVR